MNLDDIVYISLLFSSIIFGYYYKNIPDKIVKKNVGTIFGLVIVFIVSGVHIVHNFVTIAVGSLIILYADRKTCHLYNFIFCFLYLIFFRTTIYFGIPYPPAHTNLVQMMLTLKIVGLSLEMSKAHELKKRKAEVKKTEDEQFEDLTNNIETLSFMDIVHYSFNFIGVLTGPYYRYRTYIDSFEKPFAKYSDWKTTLINKLKYMPMYAVFFLMSTYYWPLSYAKSDEFYSERSWIYRYWYIWPNFFAFRMRIYIGMGLSECVCVVAGLGCYPSVTNPKPGNGPYTNFKEIVQIDDEDKLAKMEYNYETIQNINPYITDFCTTMRDGVKNWNMCVQYWLVMNVYKCFPYKQYKPFVTAFVSAVWHGVYMGYYIGIASVPFAFIVESVWVKILLKDKEGMALKIQEWIIWFFKMQLFSYLAIAMHLLELSIIWKYYNSVYHICLLLHVALYFIGIQILKTKRNKADNENNSAKKE